MALKDTERERLNGYHLWGHKSVGEYIGKGNFGCVYELLDANKPTADALKVVTIEYTPEAAKEESDPQKYLLNGLRSTLDEIQRMMELRSLRNFVAIYGYENYPIREGDELIGYDILIWMERLTVLPVYCKQRQAQGNPLQETDVLQLGMELCTGLEEANRLLSQGKTGEGEFIHRDIKPENIFVSEDGTYKLGDLGIATISRQRQYTIIGTPTYMAPEMFSDRGYRANIDLYALGRTLHRLTEGMELRSGLPRVIRRAEETEPGNRYQTAQEMNLDLEQCIRRLEHSDLEGEPTLPIRPETRRLGRESPTEKYTEKLTRAMGQRRDDALLPETVEQRTKRRWLRPLAAAAAAVVIGVSAFFGMQFWQNQQIAAQETQKDTEIVSTVEEYIRNRNYSEAILYLQDVLEEEPEDEQWQELLEQCQSDYRKSVLDKAQTAYEERDNIAAAEIVQEGLTVLPEDEQLLHYQQTYEESAPEALRDLPQLDSNIGGVDYYTEDTVQDVNGTEYQGAFLLLSWGGWKGIGSHSAFCTYALHGDYQWFDATYFMDTSSDAEDVIHFLVLADDAVIYDSGAVSAADQPKTIQLDVTGVQELTIQSKTEDYRIFGINPGILVTDAVLKPAISVD